MVKIRLKRLGRKKAPFYRIVVTTLKARRDGAPIEELGYYNPISKALKLNKEKAVAWLAKGAQASETAQMLIEKAPESGELIYLPKREPKPKAQPAPAPATKEEPKEEPKAEEPKAEEKAEEPAPVEAAVEEAAAPAEEPAPAEEAPAVEAEAPAEEPAAAEEEKAAE